MSKILEFFRGMLGPPKLRTVSVGDLDPWRWHVNTGSKFPGGFGPTNRILQDYWTLRARSAQLFETNLYARGLIRRLVTSEINVGLHLEATPEEVILGKNEDDLADWSEDVENRFALWQKNPAICDERERLTFGALQAVARMEALVSGDALVVMRQHQRTKLPRIQLISGEAVQTPLEKMFGDGTGNRVVHGVELDASDRQVAYWVRQRDGTSKRLPAYGEKSGRRLAWLVYGTEKRHSEVRGTPLLALILQSLQELDRYRDAALRKAVINSIYAAFVKKSQDKPGTRPLAGGALKRGAAVAQTNDGTPRTFAFAEQIPGAVIEELQVGEEPVPYSNGGTDINFKAFEEAIVCGIAWGNNIPPEILRLAFTNNYSASQAANNEFKIYLNLVREDFGEQFCQPVYVEWLLAQALSGKVQAPTLLESFRDFTQHDVFGAWISADWTGHIKPAVDMTKLVRAYAEAVEEGFITRDRASRELFGVKYSKNVQKLARENVSLAAAKKPLAALEAPAPPKSPDDEIPENGELPEDKPKPGDDTDDEGASASTPEEERLN